jgi:hypothetical protein
MKHQPGTEPNTLYSREKKMIDLMKAEGEKNEFKT